MRDYCPPFLAEADKVPDGRGFDINQQYTGSLFGKDRMGHTTPDAEVPAAMLACLNDGGIIFNDIHSNGFTLPKKTPIARTSFKTSSSNAPLGRSGTVTNVSKSYNAATVR